MGNHAWARPRARRHDTGVDVLSAIPVVADPDPLSTEVMERARRQVEQLGCVGHVLIQGHATPTTGALPAALDAMAATAAQFEIAAWKAYTHEGPAWRLDDDVGNAFCDQVRALGQRIICVHKGLGPAAASPVDVGPAAANHPDLTFCIYHSGFEAAVTEGEYPGDEAGADAGGVDRLIAALHGVGIPGRQTSTPSRLDVVEPDPATREAAHVLANCFVALGPDTHPWGPTRSGRLAARGRSRRSRVRDHPRVTGPFGYPARRPTSRPQSSASTPPASTDRTGDDGLRAVGRRQFGLRAAAPIARTVAAAPCLTAAADGTFRGPIILFASGPWSTCRTCAATRILQHQPTAVGFGHGAAGYVARGPCGRLGESCA